jgi:chromosome segregation ATPase
MRKLKLLSTGLILCSLISANVEAKLYKWVDDNGTTHYGETIPPEYANKDATQLNSKGIVEKRIEKLTPEEKHAKKEDEAKKNADQQAALESKRRDIALLSTFSNEKEIDDARKRSTQQVEARIDSVKTMLDSAQGALAGHLKEKEDLTRQNKKIDPTLTEDIVEDHAKVDKLQMDLAQNEKELASVKARFDADKSRYRELKGAGSAKK